MKISFRQFSGWFASLAAAVLTASAGATVLLVDDDAPPGGDGLTWVTAFNRLQDALAIAAIPANGITEVRVAQGTYQPDRTTAAPSGTGNRNARFLLITGVAIRGGYLGLSAPKGEDPNTRDIDAYVTILNGDLADDDPAAPPIGTRPDASHFTNATDNAYQVVVALNVDETAVLDGVTITGGHADGVSLGAVPESRDQGSGLNVYFASPTILNVTFLRNYNSNHGAVNDHGDFTTLINCTFRANYSQQFGAGMYSHHHSASTVTNCVMRDNVAVGEGAGGYSRSMRFAAYSNCEFINNISGNKGGGMYNAPGSGTTFNGCLFTENESHHGGGMYSDESTPMIADCLFEANASVSDGAAMYNNLSIVQITQCDYIANDCGGGGSGMWNEHGDVTIDQCYFFENFSSGGGAGVYSNFNDATMTNCLFLNNISAAEGGAIWNGENAPVITECDFISNYAVAGGGMYNTGECFPIITNCNFTNNSSTEGGGCYTLGGAPIITNCTFTNNIAAGEGFPAGGAIINYVTNPIITNCTFTGNYAEFGGGAMYNEFESPTIINCTFVRNISESQDRGWGGGVLNGYFTTARFYNCLFNGNRGLRGGAITNFSLSEPHIINCTIVGNTTDGDGGGIFNVEASNATIINTIAWDNLPNAIGGIPAIVRHSCVQGGYGPPEDFNTSVNPNFVVAAWIGPDGYWASIDDEYGDLRLASGSPCIDAGDTTVVPSSLAGDLLNEPRCVDDPAAPNTGISDGVRPIVDMGAYEHVPVPVCVADLAPAGAPDGIVGVPDLLAVINAWGACGNPNDCPADIAPPGPPPGDDVVSVPDLLAVINNWGPCE